MITPMPVHLRDLAAQMSEYGRGGGDSGHMYDAEIEAALRNGADEMDRLRVVMDNAPHDSGCQYSFLPGDKPRRCTCWKAGVL